MTNNVMESFEGIVFTREWIKWVDGKTYLGVFGTITIMNDEMAVGFRVHGGETANWIAHIKGDKYSEMYLLGCQIRGAIRLNPGWAGRMTIDEQTYLTLP